MSRSGSAVTMPIVTPAFGATVVLTAFAVLALLDIIFLATFPQLPRLGDDFSATYLVRELRALRGTRPIVVLGDSALWGYGVPARESAIVRLAHTTGRPWINLSYEGGSPANTYAMLRLLQRYGVRPRALVFNVNLKEFNRDDSSYQRLHPAVEALVWNALTPRDRSRLKAAVTNTIEARLGRALEQVWPLYGMREDLRQALFKAPDAAHAVANIVARSSGAAAEAAAGHRPTAERFEGTYDLSALDEHNVSLFFLQRIAQVVASERLPAYAILTPSNHRLLHDYIDVPEYRDQLGIVRRVLERRNIHVLDYDSVIAARDFIDNDHLTARGNIKLAQLLERDVRS